MNTSNSASPQSGLARAYRQLLGILGLSSAFAILALMVIVSVNVTLRKGFGTTLPWAIQVAEYLLYYATFAAAPWVLSQGAHIRVDLILTALPATMAAGVERIANFLGAVICIILCYYGVKATLQSAAQNSLIFDELIFPEWWLLTVLPISMGLLTIEFLIRTLNKRAP